MKNSVIRRIRRNAVLLLLLGIAGPAFAVDGVIEINEAMALAGDVTPGDTAGYPVTITQSGSYRLTSDLRVNEETSGIVLSPSLVIETVTIDLNGFSIIGPVICTGEPVTSCSPTPSGSGGSGISQGNPQTAFATVTIKNGVIRGMGNHGVHLSIGTTRVEGVRAVSNGASGIRVGWRSDVINSVAESNGESGISALPGSRVVNSAAANNGLAGISLFGDTVVLGSSSIKNGGSGITCATTSGEGCVVENSIARDNAGFAGLRLDNGGIARGTLVSSNSGYGIYVDDDCLVEANTIKFNGNTQLRFAGTEGGYARNVIRGASTVSGPGVQLDLNMCNGNTTCP